MPGYWVEDDEQQEQPSQQQDRNPLRKVVNDLEAKIKELTDGLAAKDAELNSLKPVLHKQTVSQILNDLQVPSRIAKYVPPTVETTKEAVEKWLDENGEDFGITKSDSKDGQFQPPAQQQPNIPPALMEQWMRIQSQDSQAGSTPPDIDNQQLAALGAMDKSAASVDDLIEMMRTGQAPSPA